MIKKVKNKDIKALISLYIDYKNELNNKCFDILSVQELLEFTLNLRFRSVFLLDKKDNIIGFVLYRLDDNICIFQEVYIIPSKRFYMSKLFEKFKDFLFFENNSIIYEFKANAINKKILNLHKKLNIKGL